MKGIRSFQLFALATMFLIVLTMVSPDAVWAKAYKVRIYTQSENMTPTVQNIDIELIGSNGQTHQAKLGPNHGTAAGGGIRPFRQKAVSIYLCKGMWYDYKISGVNNLEHVIKVKLQARKNPQAGQNEVIALKAVTVWTDDSTYRKWRFWSNSNKILKLDSGKNTGPWFEIKVNGWQTLTPTTVSSSNVEGHNWWPADNTSPTASAPIDLGEVQYTHVESNQLTTTESLTQKKDVKFSIKGQMGTKLNNVTAQLDTSYSETLQKTVQTQNFVKDESTTTMRIVANAKEYRLGLETIRNNEATGTFKLQFQYFTSEKKSETLITDVEYDINYGLARKFYLLGPWDHVPTADEVSKSPSLGNDAPLKAYVKANWGGTAADDI